MVRAPCQTWQLFALPLHAAVFVVVAEDIAAAVVVRVQVAVVVRLLLFLLLLLCWHLDFGL